MEVLCSENDLYSSSMSSSSDGNCSPSLSMSSVSSNSLRRLSGMSMNCLLKNEGLVVSFSIFTMM